MQIFPLALTIVKFEYIGAVPTSSTYFMSTMSSLRLRNVPQRTRSDPDRMAP